MRHYLLMLLGDGARGRSTPSKEALGVWEVRDELTASRLNMRLSLAYPGCQTIVGRARDFEDFKSAHSHIDFGEMLPEAFET